MTYILYTVIHSTIYWERWGRHSEAVQLFTTYMLYKILTYI